MKLMFMHFFIRKLYFRFVKLVHRFGIEYGIARGIWICILTLLLYDELISV